MFPFYTPKELKALGLGGIGEKVIIKKTVQLYNPSKIFIGSNVIIDDFCVVVAKDDVRIGNNVHINSYSCLYGQYGIEMHDFSGLSTRVDLYSESDDYTGRSLTNPTVPIEFRPRYQTGKVVLERHAIVGATSTVLPGVTLGEGAAVGAHSLVTLNCEPWYIYFGVPVRKLKPRKKNLLELEKAYLESLRG